MWSNSDRRLEGDTPAAVHSTEYIDVDEEEVATQWYSPTEPTPAVVLKARGDSRPDEPPPLPPPADEPQFVECPECATQNILGTWCCEHCSAILPAGEYENPDQQTTAANNLEHAANAYATRFEVKWVYRHARGRVTNRVAEIHEIRNKARKAANKGYQSVAHRFEVDATF